MKKILLLAALATGLQANAQKIYSTVDNYVVAFDTETNSETYLAKFNMLGLSQPSGRLIHIGNGELVGIARSGPMMYGGFYKTDTSGSEITTLYQFNNNNAPQGCFVLGNDGKLYGFAYTGTSNETGIYSFDLSTNTYTMEYEIPGNAKTGSLGAMFKADDGIFYGTTSRGGAGNFGTIFSFNPVSKVYTTHHEFNNTNGKQPEIPLVKANNGKLYGVTSYGGANDKGVIFSFDMESKTFTKLVDMVQGKGEGVIGPLMLASNGKLYGTAMAGGGGYMGSLFSFDPGSNAYELEYSFSPSDGYGPRSEPIEVRNGLIYGNTNSGGSGFKGSIYSFDLNSKTFTKIKDGADSLSNFSAPFISLTPVAPAGIMNTLNSLKVDMYPNPADQMVVLNELPNQSLVRILDMNGRVVYQSISQGTQMSIPCKSFANGAYMLQVVDKGNAFNQKLIVKH